MLIKDIRLANVEALKAIRENDGGANFVDYTYFGYYEVDIFECSTFLMFTNNDCPRSRDILFNRYFEPQSMKLWCRLANSATGILDIGAHVGVYSLAAAALRKEMPIHAFEPNPYAFSRLRVHKHVNGFENIIEHACAVTDRDGLFHFSWIVKPGGNISSGAGLGQRLGEEKRKVERTTVPGMSLDGLGLASTIGTAPLVKIDVEGAERLVMKGMKEILTLRPDIILETFDQESCDFINDVILPLGFRVFFIMEREARVEAREKLMPCDIKSGNFNHLITARLPDEVARLSG